MVWLTVRSCCSCCSCYSSTTVPGKQERVVKRESLPQRVYHQGHGSKGGAGNQDTIAASTGSAQAVTSRNTIWQSARKDGITVALLPGNVVPTGNICNGVVRDAAAVRMAPGETTRWPRGDTIKQEREGCCEGRKSCLCVALQEERSRGIIHLIMWLESPVSEAGVCPSKPERRSYNTWEKKEHPGGRSRWTGLPLCTWAKKADKIKRKTLLQMHLGQLRKLIWDSEKYARVSDWRDW